MPVIKILPYDVFYALSGLNSLKAMDLMECLLSFLKTVSSCWHSPWSYPFASDCQHLPFLPAGSMPFNNLCSNPSNYCHIALLSCLSKASESILNQKIQKHFSTSDLLSNHQYGFRKGRPIGNHLTLLSDSWSSSLSCFGETFLVALDISKAFDRVWHVFTFWTALFQVLSLSLCSFFSSFLSGHSISAVVDSHLSTPKPINSGVPHGSVISPTLFLLFINDLLSITNCPIHLYDDNSTLHYSTSFDRRPTPQDLQDSRLEVAEHLNIRTCSHFWLRQEEPGFL